METKQHTVEQSLGQRGNQKGIKKISQQMKTNHTIWKLMGCRKNNIRAKFIVIGAYIKKNNDLNLTLEGSKKRTKSTFS